MYSAAKGKGGLDLMRPKNRCCKTLGLLPLNSPTPYYRGMNSWTHNLAPARAKHPASSEFSTVAEIKMEVLRNKVAGTNPLVIISLVSLLFGHSCNCHNDYDRLARCQDEDCCSHVSLCMEVLGKEDSSQTYWVIKAFREPEFTLCRL